MTMPTLKLAPIGERHFSLQYLQDSQNLNTFYKRMRPYPCLVLTLLINEEYKGEDFRQES